MGWRSWKVDWPNHLIGFFSALFGILIAFELEEWRESKNHQEDARNAFEKTKKEIQFNKDILHEAVDTNLRLIDMLEIELLPFVSERLEFIGSLEAASAINLKLNPIAKIILRDTLSPSLKNPILVNMGSLRHPTLLNAAWESAKATGVINYIEYEKVLSISSLYNTPRITDELLAIKTLLRNADEITTKSRLKILLKELRESHLLIQSELADYDAFVNIIQTME